jgi:hypothetical protein
MTGSIATRATTKSKWPWVPTATSPYRRLNAGEAGHDGDAVLRPPRTGYWRHSIHRNILSKIVVMVFTGSHRSIDGERNCGGELRPICENKLQTARRGQLGVYGCAILRWSFRRGRLRRLSTEMMAIDELPANPTERERRNSSSTWLPPMLYSSRRLYSIRRVDWATARTLGCPPSTAPWRSPATESCRKRKN